MTADELDRSVTRELGRTAFDHRARELVVRGHITRNSAGRYVAVVEFRRGTGEALGVRQLTSDNLDCRSLDEALAVMLAIMLNVSREEQAAPAESLWSLRLAAGGMATLGRMPGAGIGVTASGGPVLPAVVGFELEALAELGPSRPVAEGAVETRALSGRLGVSPVLWAPGAELAFVLKGGAGLVQATATGFDTVARRTRPAADAMAGLRLSLPVAAPLWLEITGDFGVALLRPRFFVRNEDGSRDQLFRPSLVFGALGLALAFAPR